ncbi:hypothetical protein LIPSTDRAFT_256177 [Lipomyces starkeyi NRRL Y-11557]|uniref:Uncharacterized protein n=1 Tax=Lipomyces starkeyi NRRL Y-11557 TaxID=675824 RepID=A0A1E3QA22_LIPST|nr:hypothetical protein LIPSTDRAFT_256177 [Lipomyces starkeyi NRRL Y-11557]
MLKGCRASLSCSLYLIKDSRVQPLAHLVQVQISQANAQQLTRRMLTFFRSGFVFYSILISIYIKT